MEFELGGWTTLLSGDELKRRFCLDGIVHPPSSDGLFSSGGGAS